MAKKKIELNVKLEKGTNNLLLDSQDAFDVLGEKTEEEMRLFQYIDKWCQWLNYYFTHSPTCNGNIEETSLRAWIGGFNFAEGIEEEEFDNRYVLTMKGYTIILYKPFSI